MQRWMMSLVGVCLFLISATAQTLRIINVQIQRPTPAALSAWSRDPNIVRIFVQNTGAKVYSDVRVIFEIQREGSTVVVMDPNDPAVPRFNFAPGITVITGPELVPPALYQSGGVDIVDSEIEKRALRTQQLPEGQYAYCVWLVDAAGRQIHRYETCPIFEILLPEPPVLLAPEGRFDLPDPDRSPPVFQWTGITPVPPGVAPQYRLVIVPIFRGQSAREAIDRNEPLFDRIVNGTSYPYQLSDPSFHSITGTQRFAWQIQALDQFGNPIAVRGDNEGKSEIAAFGFAAAPEGGKRGKETPRLQLVAHWPRDNDTIPWRHPLLIVRFQPYNDSLRGVRFRVTVEGDGVRLTNERNLRWPQGPARSQGVSPERATYHFVNAVDDRGRALDWSAQLERGKVYRWQVTAEFRWADGSTTVVETAPHTFVLGLRQPRRIAPPQMQRFPVGTAVRLRWQTPAPTALSYTPEELISLIRRNAFLSVPWARERIQVEVSRTEDFRSIVTTATTEHPAGALYRLGDGCAEFFQERELRTPPLTEPGVYYWRVRYLDDAGAPYLIGPVWRFQIVGEGDRHPVSAEDCLVLRPLSPEGDIPVANPVFRGVVRPVIALEGIQRAWIRIWQAEGETDDSAAVVRRRPVFEHEFVGTDFLRITPYSLGAVMLQFQGVNTTGATLHFTAEPGQRYWWQFELTVDPANVRSDGQVCERRRIYSRIVQFRYQPEEAPCAYRCETPPVRDREPRSEPLSIGERITIGAFQLTITQLANPSPTALSGQGYIEIPALRLPLADAGLRLAVSFERLQVNRHNQVYAGEAKAIIADDAPLSAEVANAIEAGVRDWRQREIQQVDQYLRTARRLLSLLRAEEPLTLPIGLDRVIGSKRVVVALVGAVFRPATMPYPGGRLNVMAWIELPELMGPDRGIGLGARKICFHPQGLNLTDGVLYLPTDIVLSDRDGAEDLPTWEFRFRGWRSDEDRGTYAEWDCSGFRAFQLDVEVAFSRNTLLPVDADGRIIEDPARLVRGRATARLERSPRSRWGFLLEGELEECALARAPGFRFRGSSPIAFTIDLSAFRNPPALHFPAEYVGTTDSSWMGFYLSSLFLQLPQEFRQRSAADAPRIGLEQVLIDGTGVSFALEATNIAENLDFNNWGGSIDTLRFRVVQSAFREAMIAGRLTIPVTDSVLFYRGVLNRARSDSLSFVFTLRARDTLNFPLTRVGKLAILPSSTFELRVEGGNFLPTVLLDGSLNVAGSLPDLPGIDFRGVNFERFGVRSQGDRVTFESGRWAFASPQHQIAGFPISIREIGVITGSCEGNPGAALRIGLDINLFSESGAGVSGGTTLSFWGSLQREPRWHLGFCQVELNEIRLVADLGGAVRIDGTLAFYRNDRVYGNGFRGEVRADVAQLVSAVGVVQFGAVAHYRYWFVDVRAYLPAGIPVGTAVAIYGFGGGAWYNMRREAAPSQPPRDSRVANVHTPGATASGFRFVPDPTGSFGLRAMVSFGTHPDPFLLNGDATLEAEFSTGTGGGIRFIRLQGDYWMLCNARQRNKAPMWGNLVIQLNFEPAVVLDGTFAVHIDAPRGVGMLRGGGQMALHVASDAWYFWIGRPTARVGLSMGIGELRLTSVGSYFQMGTQLDPIPPLPEEVVALLGEPPTTSMRNAMMIAGGQGIAFGQELDFHSGRLQFLAFYAQFRLLMGYDISLVNYGGTLRCAGYERPGLNGWYATGQLYAYVHGDIGIHVDLWFFEGNLNILELTAAARLSAGLPNPTWLAGAVGGRFSVLGGAVKGYCNFEFTLGTRCTPPRLTPFEMDIIADLRPRENAQNVDVFVSPQAAFNFAVNEPFEIEELDEDGNSHIRTYRVLVTAFTVRKDAAGAEPVAAHRRLGPDGVVLTLEPEEMLEGNRWYRVAVTAKGQEWRDGQWKDVRKADGTPAVQTKEHRFRTGPAPEDIPERNIAALYPRKRQRYFLVDECPEGYIHLRRGMQSLLNEPGYRLIVRFIAPGRREPIEVPAHYRARAVRFEIPSTLQSSTIYALQLIKKRVRTVQERLAEQREANLGLSSIVWEQWRQVLARRGANVLVRQRVLPARVVRSGEKLLYAYHFRTSEYRTLRQKVMAIFQGARARAAVARSGLVTAILLEKSNFAEEWFDTYDLQRRGGEVVGRDVVLGYPRTSLYWRQRVEPWLYQPVRQIPGFGGTASLMLERASVVALAGLYPRTPLQESEIRDAFFPNYFRIRYRYHTGLPKVTVKLRLPGIVWWDYTTFLRPRASRLLVEDAFIRTFERVTGHRWDSRNQKQRLPFLGDVIACYYGGSVHSHSFRTLGLSPAHFPWALSRKLSAAERRIVRRIADGRWNPALWRRDLGAYRHWATTWRYFGGSCAPAPDRPLPTPVHLLMLLP